jgi:hypothetical protein
MAPRLKILMPSGSKKGTQKYCPFLSKSLASESPPDSLKGPLWREIPTYRAFFTFLLMVTYLLGSPVKEPSL